MSSRPLQGLGCVTVLALGGILGVLVTVVVWLIFDGLWTPFLRPVLFISIVVIAIAIVSLRFGPRSRSLIFQSILIIIIFFAFLLLPVLLFFSSSRCILSKSLPGCITSIRDIPIIREEDDPIGISDGAFAFDTNRTDGDLKQKAAEALKGDDPGNAKRLWKQAIDMDTSDAEALIYLENQRVLEFRPRRPYITLIVGTTLTGGSSAVTTGRDNLQGAYVAQKEYNDKQNIGVLVRLLIVNAGSKADYVAEAVQQIKQAVQIDRTIVGVMGWPFSAYARKAVDALKGAQLPMVSPSASDDGLTGVSPYFFRVVPANIKQAVLAAKYVEGRPYKKIVVFEDRANPYSGSLAQDFIQQITSGNSGVMIVREQYTVGQPQTLGKTLQEVVAQNSNIGLVYFSGYADDAGVLLANLQTSGLKSQVPILGGDALNELGGYSATAKANLGRLYFTAFAYPDEWNIVGLGDKKPEFFKLYPIDFDPQHSKPEGTYGYNRADNDAILSYDATKALLEGCKIAIEHGKKSPTPNDLRQSLTQIRGDQAIQGASGLIEFGSDGDPVNKPVILVNFNSNIQLQFEIYNGCLTKDTCRTL